MTVDIVTVEPRLAAVVRKTVPMADLREVQNAAQQTLAAALVAADIQPLGRLTIWRMPAAGMIDYAPGVLVPHAFEAAGGVSVLSLPSGRAAHGLLRGSYDGMQQAWARLFDSCASEGLPLAGVNWEIYGGSSPDSLTDLYALLAA